MTVKHFLDDDAGRDGNQDELPVVAADPAITRARCVKVVALVIVDVILRTPVTVGKTIAASVVPVPTDMAPMVIVPMIMIVVIVVVAMVAIMVMIMIVSVIVLIPALLAVIVILILYRSRECVDRYGKSRHGRHSG